MIKIIGLSGKFRQGWGRNGGFKIDDMDIMDSVFASESDETLLRLAAYGKRGACPISITLPIEDMEMLGNEILKACKEKRGENR